MSVKIQINSLQSLEQLIGRDSELWFELRNAVVQEFCKKHLKGIVTKEVLAENSEMFKNDVVQKLNDLLRSPHNKTTLNLVNELEKKYLDKSEIEEAIQRTVKRIENEMCDTLIEDRINKLVDRRLKERLGMTL